LFAIGWPDGITDEAQRMRDLWIGSSIAAMVVGVAVWALIAWAAIRYRKRGNELPRQTAYNLPLEIVYTIIPFIIIAVLFFYTVTVQNRVQQRSEDPDVTIAVNAFKWNWQFVYPDTTESNGGEPISTVGDSSEIPILVVPVDQTVREEGSYVGRCAELCGTYHAFMNFEVRSVSAEDFEAYLDARESGLSTFEALESIGQDGAATTTQPFELGRQQQAALQGE
jgi:cytochrome c oxidase subunit 2